MSEIVVRVHIDGASWVTTDVVSPQEAVLRLVTDTGEIELHGELVDLLSTVVEADRALTHDAEAPLPSEARAGKGSDG